MTILLSGGTVIAFKTTGKPASRSVDIPTEAVVPWNLTSFIPQDNLLYQGWPDVPDIWVRGTSLTSSDGTYLNSDRPDPYSVFPNAHTRMIADDVHWDEIAGTWSPFYSGGVDYSFTSSMNPPVIEDISYLCGKEMIRADAYRFYPGVVLRSSFNSDRDDASEFGISMVVCLHSPTDYPLLYIGGNNPIRIDVRDAMYLTFAGKTAKVPLLANPGSMTPLYVILMVTPTTATLYAGTGPNKLTAVQMNRPTPLTTDMIFTIGSDNLVSSNAAFHLMDFAMFTGLGVNDVANMLSSAYGVS